jgi:DNA-directed RNA polymerase I subunit RPA49
LIVFTKANSSRSSEMPRWNIDKLNTHIAAAALIVDDNEVDVNDLRDDLKIDNKECVLSSNIIVHQKLTSNQDPSILC